MLFFNKQRKTLASNIFSLILLQGTNYLIPLVLIAFLPKTIGIDNYGKICFFWAITSYFQVIADYGFDIIGTKQVSENRISNCKCSIIFYEILSVKLLLLAAMALLVVMSIFFIKYFSENAVIFSLSFLGVLGQVMFPSWFFQGMEAMKATSALSISIKIFTTILIFLFVKSPCDYWIVPLLTSIGFILIGFSCLFYAIKKYKIKFYLPTKAGLKLQFSIGWNFFQTRIYVNLYTSTNIVLLGCLTNNSIVGIYSASEKIINAFSGIFPPIFQAFFPYLTTRHASSPKEFFSTCKSLCVPILFISILLAAVAFCYSEIILNMFGIQSNNDQKLILSLLSLTIITSPFASMFTNIMVIIGNVKMFSETIRKSFILNMLIIFPLIYFYSGIGCSIAYVLVQYYTMIVLYTKIKKYETSIKQ